MFPQTPTISLFIVLASLVLCNGYYIQEPFYKTNVKHYLVHDGRLIKTKHEHFGLLTRANRAIHLSSSRPRGTVSVDDFGAKADGRDDSEVAYHVINKKDKIFTCKFSSFSISFNFLLFLAILLVLQAFGKAWNEACSRGAILVVPENRIYRLKPIIFSGPCRPNTAFMVRYMFISNAS